MADEEVRISELLGAAVPPSPVAWTADAQPLTAEAVRNLIEKIRHEPLPAPHGTEERPHLFSPNPESLWYDFCIECGMERWW